MACMDAETLCLSKTDAVYLNCSNLSPHHIAGIRFTYRQYKKKNPGVVLNDGPHNRRLQIVSLIQAVYHQFGERPSVLVMCETGHENDWMMFFIAHTDLGNDVVVESSRKFPKKSIVVSAVENCSWLGARPWRLVVVDDDSAHSCVLQYSFKADFKIWSTSINMKKNLDTFTAVYQWIYPKHRFNSAEFIADKTNVKDMVDKAILLDAFMEDILIRRMDLDDEEAENVTVPPKPVSRKNKDATGTKIKRSKPKIVDNATVSNNVETPKPTTANEDNDKAKTNLESVVTGKQTNTNLYSGNSSQGNEVKLESSSVPGYNVCYALNTQHNKMLHANELGSKIVNYDKNSYVSFTMQDSGEPVNKRPKIEIDEVRTNFDLIEIIHVESNDVENKDGVEVNNTNLDDQTQTLITAIDELKTDAQIIAYDTDDVVVEKSNHVELIIPESEENDNMEIENAVNNVTDNDQQATKDLQKDDVNGGGNDVEGTDKQGTSDKCKVTEFEQKNNEYMEQAMKRFKGSVFDSLF